MNRPYFLDDAAASGGSAAVASPAAARRKSLAAMVIWALVMLGLYNVGGGHYDCIRINQTYYDGTLWENKESVLAGMRCHFTDDGDLRRYYSYTNALLGWPYFGYYVRGWEDWQREFATGQPAPIDDGPLRTPEQPLRPYRDYLVEYPPGFFLFTLLPALLVPPGDHGDLFRVLFCTEMALLLAGATWLCGRMRRLLPGGAAVSGMSWLWLTGAAGALLLGTVATHRFDPVVSALLCAIAWAALSARPGLAGGLLAAAVAIKGVPLLVTPIWAVYVLLRPQASHQPADRSGFWRALAAALLVGGSFTAATLFFYGLTPFDSLRYHSLRPLQLESTFAALLGLAQAIWPGTIAHVNSYGSSNLIPVGDVLVGLDAALRRLSSPLLLLGAMAVYAVTGLRLRALAQRGSLAAMGEWALRGQAAVLVVYMVMGKVFSPQYLVWLLPLGLFLSLRAGIALTGLFLVILGLTQLVFPGLYGALQSLKPWAFAVLLSRNSLLLGWAVLLLARPLPGGSRALRPRSRGSAGTGRRGA